MTAPTHNKQSAGSSADSTADDTEELAQLDLDDDDEEPSDGIAPCSSLNTVASTQSSKTDTKTFESSIQDKFDFDRTTIVVNLQILPLHENERKLLIAVGVADEPPLLFGSTLSALEVSSLPLVQAIKKLKESLPQMQACSSLRQQPQPKQVPTRQVVVPDLPQAPVARPSDLNQLKLF